jgi:hypothetical protein
VQSTVDVYENPLESSIEACVCFLKGLVLGEMMSARRFRDDRDPTSRAEYRRFGDNFVRKASAEKSSSALNFFESFLESMGMVPYKELAIEELLKKELYQKFACYLVEHAKCWQNNSRGYRDARGGATSTTQ